MVAVDTLFDMDRIAAPAGWYTPGPNLVDYDLIILNVSGGKDSQVMLDVVARAAEHLGVQERCVASFIDLGPDWEWPDIDRWVAHQVGEYGIRLVVGAKTGETMDQRIERRAAEGKPGWADNSRRWCTSDYKRGPGSVIMTRLVNELSLGRPARVLNVFGYRAAESPARAGKTVFFRDATASTASTRWVDEWSPIHRWSDKQVWAWIGARDLPYFPAYDLAGVDRISCVCCQLAGEKQVRAGIRAVPRIGRRLASLETRIGRTFQRSMSIAALVDEELGAGPDAADVTFPLPDRRRERLSDRKESPCT